MKSKIEEVVLLCEHCQQPFSETPEPRAQAPPFILCLRCRRLKTLVAVRCAGCQREFPRLRDVIRERQRYCRHSFCPACHAVRSAPKTVRVTCTDCGRSYVRTHRAEHASEYLGHKRRICPICRPAKMVMVTCVICRRQFSRPQAFVRDKQRRGYRWAICPRCHSRRSNRQSRKEGK